VTFAAGSPTEASISDRYRPLEQDRKGAPNMDGVGKATCAMFVCCRETRMMSQGVHPEASSRLWSGAIRQGPWLQVARVTWCLRGHTTTTVHRFLPSKLLPHCFNTYSRRYLNKRGFAGPVDQLCNSAYMPEQSLARISISSLSAIPISFASVEQVEVLPQWASAGATMDDSRIWTRLEAVEPARFGCKNWTRSKQNPQCIAVTLVRARSAHGPHPRGLDVVIAAVGYALSSVIFQGRRWLGKRVE